MYTLSDALTYLRSTLYKPVVSTLHINPLIVLGLHSYVSCQWGDCLAEGFLD